MHQILVVCVGKNSSGGVFSMSYHTMKHYEVKLPFSLEHKFIDYTSYLSVL